MKSFAEYQSYLESFMSADEARALVEALTTTEAVTSVRLNIRKASSFSPGYNPVPWCKNGIYLEERIPFTFDPLLHAGAYYVQDASSMVYETIVSILRASMPQHDQIRYLDMCAAPGGKATAALNALQDSDLVVANEINGTRAKILLENLTKWGAPNCMICSDDSARFAAAGENFDIVAVDAPCSGEGMMRKDADAVSQWSEGLVEQCAALQHTIVENAWQALKPDGYLIYSTCTFNRTENELMAEYIIDSLGGESINMKLDSFPGISAGMNTVAHCYRFMPHKTKGEGLFVAVFHKPSDQSYGGSRLKAKQATRKSTASAIPPTVAKYLSDSHNFALRADAETIYALPTAHAQFITALAESVRTLQRSTPVVTLKGKDLIPTPALALSTALGNAIPTAEVDYATAISYLRGESIVLPINTPKGYVAVEYSGHVIGFIKNLGNRANNLYPKEWRIRSTHAPEIPPSIISHNS